MAKLTASDLDEIEALLRRDRLALLASLRQRLPALDSGPEAAGAIGTGEFDVGQAAALSDDEAAVVDHDIAELRAIDAALRRIEFNVGGLCVKCGEAIALERLRLVPSATLCAACAGLPGA